ncbi:MAG: alpha/beta fold hydrolase [Methanobacterium sp.]
MPDKIRIFESSDGEAQYNAAYDAILKQWPVPYDEIYIPTRFGDTHVIASGSKDNDPLILLSSSAGGATQWFLNVGPLSQHYRTYAIDLIGEVNKSILTSPVTSRQEFADWIEDLFNGLQIESAYMVGNSFGGFLTFNTALYLPGRVNKVVLISPAATFVQMWAWYINLLIPAHMIAPIIRSKGMVQRAYDWLWQEFPMDENYARLRNVTKMVAYPRYRINRNKVLPHVYSDEDLRKIRTPILLLIGDQEVIYKPETAIERATRLVDGLKAEIVSNANHTAQLTVPDVVNNKILDFFLD